MNNDLLQQVYQQYSREIYVYLFTLCKNHDMAEDLRQETFLKAILSLPDGHTNVRAWLYRVARNLCFNQLKRDKHTDEGHSPDERAPLYRRTRSGGIAKYQKPSALPRHSAIGGYQARGDFTALLFRNAL